MKWLLIGASTIAQQFVIDAIRAGGDEISWLVSGDEQRAAAFAVKNNIARFTTDLKLALSQQDIDAVYISTTNEKHFPQAMLALEYGKHVLCEKPMALSMEEATTMIERASACNQVLAVNHHLRNAATIRKMRDEIRNGTLGDILTVRFCHAVSLPENLIGWRTDNSAGNGVIMDITVHDIDTLRFLLDDDVVAVSAMAQDGLLSQSGSVETVMGTLRFSKGTLVSFFDSFTARNFETSIDVIGTQGTLRARNILTQNPVGEVTLHNRHGSEPLAIEHASLYERGLASFRDAIFNGGQPAASGDDGRQSLAVSLAVVKAVSSGITVHIGEEQ
ncbi:Gfo/Idh/MocA family protein [Erwinia sp. SLM-02]|uniref:Gfo/Idh/MocA family protein n=1 Tax=Erwinia sp. SLM-02 TaxID=3020057 RepID=UPI003080B0C0